MDARRRDFLETLTRDEGRKLWRQHMEEQIESLRDRLQTCTSPDLSRLQGRLQTYREEIDWPEAELMKEH